MTAAENDATATREGRHRERLLAETSTSFQITAEQKHRAALVVAGHASSPGDARELLDMLGLPTGSASEEATR